MYIAKSDFMSSILNGSTSVKKTCINYPLNSDVLNCEQIISFLPQAYRASTAGCIVCFLISSLYLLVIIRVSFCPGCCAFAEKSVFPGSADPGVTDEEKMIDSALKMTGIRKPPPDPHAHIMDTRTKLSKYEKKNGSPLFLAWYAEK